MQTEKFVISKKGDEKMKNKELAKMFMDKKMGEHTGRVCVRIETFCRNGNLI